MHALLAAALLLQTAAEEVPFELVENIVVVRGTINGRAATWVVDTGANVTVVTPEAARKAGVEGESSGLARLVAAGGAQARDLRVTIADPPVAAFLRKAGLDYQGILGTTFLEKFLVTLDYDRKTLVLAPPDAPERAGTAVPFELRNDLIFVECRVNGRGPHALVLDCGAQATVLRPKVAKALDIRGVSARDQGRLDIEWARLDSFAVGAVAVERLDVALHEPPQSEALARQGIAFDGFVGYNFLARFKVTIDYRKREVWLADPRAAPRPVVAADKPGAERPAKKPLGLSLRDTVVLEVEKESAAEAAGFRAGDVIVQIEGNAMRYVEEIRAVWMGAKEGAVLVFRVRRGDGTVDLKLER